MKFFLICISLVFLISCSGGSPENSGELIKVESDDFYTVKLEKSGSIMSLVQTGRPFETRRTSRLHKEGLRYLELEKYKRARSKFRRAEKAEPNNPLIQNSLGIVECKLSNFEKSEEHLLKAIEMDQKFVLPYLNLGLTYYYAKKYLNAIQVLKSIDLTIASEREMETSYFHLFMTYTRLEDCKSAFYYYELAKLSSNNYLFLENIEEFRFDFFDIICPEFKVEVDEV